MSNKFGEHVHTGGEVREGHHTVDHKPGGPSIGLPATKPAWIGIEVVNPSGRHFPSEIARLETLIGDVVKRFELPAAALLTSQGHAASLVWLPGGHSQFDHVKNVWHAASDQHPHPDAGFERKLHLCAIAEIAGRAEIDPGAHDVLAIETLAADRSGLDHVVRAAVSARGFLGAAAFLSDGAGPNYLWYRFDEPLDLDDFRSSAAVTSAIGQPTAFTKLHTLKTFPRGPSPAHG